MSRHDVVEEKLVSHRATTDSDGYETAEDTSTTSHESPAADEVEAPPVHLGTYGDTTLDAHAGVVAPAVCYVIIDEASWEGDHGRYFNGWYGDTYGAEQYMRPDSIARASQYIPGEETPENRAHDMVRDLQSQRTTSPVGSLWGNCDPQGHPEPRSLAKEVGDSSETAYHNEMYVTPKVVERWTEIHWLCIDARCWKATYGPNTDAWAYIYESKDADGRPWPEWTGEQPYDHTSNHAREEARQMLGRDLAILDYTWLVIAMVGEHISIATELTMAHLSIQIRMSHALQKQERWAVGKDSLRDDITRAKDLYKRTGDQIEMTQYIRGRVGDDRDAILAMHDRPDLLPKEWPPSALLKGRGGSKYAASEC
jgi:hypothetical protein